MMTYALVRNVYDLVNDWNASHHVGIVLPMNNPSTFSRESSILSDASDTDYVPPSAVAPSSKRPCTPPVVEDEAVPVTVTTRANDALSKLLDPERLEAELDMLVEGHNYQNMARGYTPPDLSNIVDLLIQRSSDRAVFTSAFSAVDLETIQNQKYPTFEIDLILARMKETVKVLPTLLVGSYQVELIHRALRMETARCLVIIYDWFVVSGPLFVSAIFKLRNHPSFESNCPQYHQAVNHIYEFVESYIVTKAKPPTRHTTEYIARPNDADRALKVERAQELSRIPVDLYGIITTTSKSTFALTNPSGHGTSAGRRLTMTKACVEQQAQACFMDALSKQLVGDVMARLDKNFQKPGDESKAMDTETVQSRCLARGFILHTLAKICGTEGIFASQAMFDIMMSPTHLLIDQSARFAWKRLGAIIMHSPEDLSAPLVARIEKLLDPDLKVASDNLGAFVHERMVEFKEGGKPSQANPSSPAKSPSKRPVGEPDPDRIPLQVTLESILRPNSNVELGVLGIILRDVLNKCRGLPCVHEQIEHLLSGSTANGMDEVDDDFVNPIREMNAGTALLRQKFKDKPLTSKHGLSNFLAWFGTGQGNGTRSFLNLGGFWFTTLEDCVARFTEANERNLDLATPQNGGKVSKLPGFIKFDNQRIYSTANNHLAVIQTKILPRDKTAKKQTNSKKKQKVAASDKEFHDIRHKFAPYFDAKITAAWEKHLTAHIFNRDLKDVEEKDLPTWYATWKMIKDLGVSGFGSGLTPFQATNAMCFLGLCQRPTPLEMAMWLGENANGAKSGLLAMGFHFNTSATRTQKTAHVKAAFLIIFSHLEESLTQLDKDHLCWGPIFLEHVLCKRNRLPKLLQGVDFRALGPEAVSECEWEAEQNETDNKAFPFPLTITRSQMEDWLDDWG